MHNLFPSTLYSYIYLDDHSHFVSIQGMHDYKFDCMVVAGDLRTYLLTSI